jgi:hypothetical protein
MSSRPVTHMRTSNSYEFAPSNSHEVRRKYAAWGRAYMCPKRQGLYVPSEAGLICAQVTRMRFAASKQPAYATCVCSHTHSLHVSYGLHVRAPQVSSLHVCVCVSVCLCLSVSVYLKHSPHVSYGLHIMPYVCDLSKQPAYARANKKIALALMH